MLLPLLLNNLLSAGTTPTDGGVWCVVEAQGFGGLSVSEGFGGGAVAAQGYMSVQPAQGERCD